MKERKIFWKRILGRPDLQFSLQSLINLNLGSVRCIFRLFPKFRHSDQAYNALGRNKLSSNYRQALLCPSSRLFIIYELNSVSLWIVLWQSQLSWENNQKLFLSPKARHFRRKWPQEFVSTLQENLSQFCLGPEQEKPMECEGVK